MIAILYTDMPLYIDRETSHTVRVPIDRRVGSIPNQAESSYALLTSWLWYVLLLFQSKLFISQRRLKAIPTVPGGTNHTPEFTKSTATPEAHKATLNVAKALSAVGFRVLFDDHFFEEVGI